MTPDETYRKVVDAWNSNDPNAVGAQYAPDAVVYDPTYPEPLRGRDAIVEDYKATLAAFPELQAKRSNIFTTADGISFELQLSGTNSGPLAFPEGTYPATGRSATWNVGVFARINEQGEIVEERRYYDQVSFLQQLGIGELVSV